MPTFELSEDEHDAVVMLIRHTLDETKYPYSDENQTLRRALRQLVPVSAPRSNVEWPPLLEASARRRVRRI
jgi:hypothetical protein